LWKLPKGSIPVGVSDEPDPKQMRLSDFIRTHSGKVIDEWENFARTLVPAAVGMTPLALRDHIQEILSFVADDIESLQTGDEQIQKSLGAGPKSLPAGEHSAAEIHADLRLTGGFDINQMVSEYRALRACVIRLWSAEHPEMNSQDVLDLIRFSEAIDQALTESISRYMKKLDHSKNLFLSILGHDLRNPLGAILSSAELMLYRGILDQRNRMLASQIVESTLRVNGIISNVLDLTRARFGSGLPIIKASMDFGFVARQMIDEMRAVYPKRELILEISGDTEGEWDKARIGQVFSNLLGNAVQYSFNGTPIKITVKGGVKDVTLSVHNQGIPIPADKAERIFDSLTRGAAENGQEQSDSTNLGLGLYITKEIVTAHGGTIDVISSETDGTTFSARFPRSVVLHS
jgi:signal transduction histidine kinase